MLTAWSGNAHDEAIWIYTNWPGDAARGLFSFRHGGMSEKPYNSLNVGLAVEDVPANVEQNRRIVSDKLGGNLSDWILGQQVHGSHVEVVGLQDKGRGATVQSPAVPGTDGLVTNIPGITLAVLAADCVPVLFYDPVRKAIGAAHSGWKGTVARISGHVVQTMYKAFGSVPQDLHVWLGPSIRRCCYEVDEHVAEQVRPVFGERFLTKRPSASGKYLLGLQDCIRADLESNGVPSHQITDTGVCTSCRVNHLFSHRRENGSTGRGLGAVRLCEQ